MNIITRQIAIRSTTPLKGAYIVFNFITYHLFSHDRVRFTRYGKDIRTMNNQNWYYVYRPNNYRTYSGFRYISSSDLIDDINNI